MKTTRLSAPPAPLPPSSALAREGRRLAAAFLNPNRDWLAHSEAYNEMIPEDAPIDCRRRWEARGGRLCGRNYETQRAMVAFVLRVTGRAPLSGPAYECPQSEKDVWPAAAVQIGGVLWVVLQNDDGDPGDLRLTHLVTGDVTDLDGVSKGGVL